jgi:hypothetical protein
MSKKGMIMKLFKKLFVVTLAAFALGSGTASANVIEHIHVVLQSGATFDGNITFADHYTAMLDVDGYLVGGPYGNAHLTSTFNIAYLGTSDDATHATGIDGVLTDFLLDGDPLVDYQHALGISWYAPADSLSIYLDASLATSYAGVDAGDRIVSVTVDTPAPPPAGVPEPASLALLGLGLAGAAAARRRKVR